VFRSKRPIGTVVGQHKRRLGDQRHTGVARAFSVLGKVGVARIEHKVTATSASSTRTNLAYGVGAQYDFTPIIAFRAQYERLGTIGDRQYHRTGQSLAAFRRRALPVLML